MSVNREDAPEGFLRRWSRVKTEARDVAAAPAEEATPAAAREARADEPPPDLPPVEKLTMESDFSGFFHPKVDEDLRRKALRKLFSEPHFNVMDGLDVYIDDYSKSEPIPAAMLASLKQAQRILEWAADTGETKEKAGDTAAAAAESAPACAPATLEELPGDAVPQPALNSSQVPLADELAAPLHHKT